MIQQTTKLAKLAAQTNQLLKLVRLHKASPRIPAFGFEKIIAAIFLAFGLCTSAHAQYALDFRKPAVVDPVWFADVNPISRSLPKKAVNDDVCNISDVENCLSGYGGGGEFEFIQAKPLKINKAKIKKMEALSRKFPKKRLPRVEIAYEYLRAHRFDLFFPEINKQLALPVQNMDALIMRADTLAALGRDDLALTDVEVAIHWATAGQQIDHDSLFYARAILAELQLRAGNKLEATNTLAKLPYVEDRTPWRNARIATVTQYVTGWSNADLLRIDAAVKRGINNWQCLELDPDVVVAQQQNYRRYDVAAITTQRLLNCKQWDEAFAQANWLQSKVLDMTIPFGKSDRIDRWMYATKFMARAMNGKGETKQAQRYWADLLYIEQGTWRVSSEANLLQESIVAERAKGIEPSSYVAEAMASELQARAKNEQLRIAEEKEALQRKIAQNEAMRQSSANGTDGLGGFMRACMSLQSEVSPVHSLYARWRQNTWDCEEGRRDGMRTAGDDETYQYYRSIQFPWQ
jgi:hypothetical protein